MTYTAAAVERAMKAQDVILRALSGRQSWLAVADGLGVSPRTVRRWRFHYERYGYDGLLDRRRRRPSLRAVPVAEVQRVLRLYRERYGPRDGHPGFNVRHFYAIARRAHGVTVSYSFVKSALQAAGLVRKQRARGRHRRRREPRPCFGELVHLDGSLHPWLALVADERQTLIAAVDDATKRLLYAHLVDGGESLPAIMTALRTVLETFGIPGALYTDRAGWAVYTPTSGTAPDRTRRTQVGRALAQLGIEHIVSFSPQARGRSERTNGTLQGAWSMNCASPASARSAPPLATWRSASSPTTTPRSAGARQIPPARSCRWAATISIRSCVMKRTASSPGTIPCCCGNLGTSRPRYLKNYETIARYNFAHHPSSRPSR